MLESLDLPFVQRGLAEVALLSVGAGLIGTWVVLRGLAFYSHAVGTAAFPGLVLADGLGFAATLGALGSAALFALVLAFVARRRSDDRGSEVALVLVGMLALGVILASDVFESSAGLETLLFGSLLLVDNSDLALAGGVSALAIVAAAVAGRHWVARGFEGEGDAAGAPAPPGVEIALLGLIALVTVAALTAVGALLVTALFVVPAATTRIWTSRMRSWQLATIALCVAEGTAGVILSVELNAPPGATIAVLSGCVFAVAAVASALRRGGAGRRPLARWGLAGTLILLISGCGGDSGDRPSVVATTPIVGDLAAAVAGDEVEMTTLLAANTDPHDYEPRPDDVEALAQADLVVSSGGDLDEWIAAALEDSGSDAELVDLASVIAPGPLGDDPHWWHDPLRAASAAAAIADSIAELEDEDADPEPGRTPARDYLTELRSTDAAIERCIESVPAADRKLVTDHDAFGYLADRYDLEVVGAVIPATTTEAQASAGELADLRETIEREDVEAVFPETSVASDLAATIADETGATAEYELYGDSLGPEGSSGETYLGMIRANADALVRGFTGGERGCDA